MSAVVILFAAGILLLGVEVLTPGGVLAALAGICFLAGVATSFLQLGPEAGLIATGLAVVLGGATLYLELFVFPHTRFARRMFATETVAGRSQPELADRSAVLNREVVAVTTLAPSGFVDLDGRRYEAYSRSGKIDPGARLRIVDVDTFRLVVTPIKDLA
jgi:membrane-bound ClpP family serine protease